MIRPLVKSLGPLSPEDVDILIEDRDTEKYLQPRSEAQKAVKGLTPSPKLKTKIDDLKKAITVLVFQKTGSSDLAYFISSDAELIALHVLNDSKDAWISDLYYTYSSGQIPWEGLKHTDAPLTEQLAV